MLINEYQKECLRTMPKFMPRGEETLMGLMGLNSEAGECINLYKKTLFNGDPLDNKQLVSDLGDALWYIAVTAHALDYDLETIMQANIDKLKTKYPNGFSLEESLNRYAGDIYKE